MADVAVYFTCAACSVTLMAILADELEPGIAAIRLDDEFLAHIKTLGSDYPGHLETCAPG